MINRVGVGLINERIQSQRPPKVGFYSYMYSYYPSPNTVISMDDDCEPKMLHA